MLFCEDEFHVLSGILDQANREDSEKQSWDGHVLSGIDQVAFQACPARGGSRCADHLACARCLNPPRCATSGEEPDRGERGEWA